jgi:hypothetical protein
VDEASAEATVRGKGDIAHTTGPVMAGAATVLTEVEPVAQLTNWRALVPHACVDVLLLCSPREDVVLAVRALP